MPGEPEPHPLVEHERRPRRVPVGAHLAPRRARAGRRTRGRRCPRAPSAGACDHALETPLAGGVRRHEGPRPDRDVGGDEDDVAAAPLRPSPGTNARTSRCAPTTVRSSSRANRSESTSVIVPGRDRAGVRDHHLDVAEVAGRPPWRTSSTESSSVRSSGCTTASPPSARIWAATSSSLSVRRAPSATGKPAGPARSAVAAPMPERGAGDDGGAAVGLVVLARWPSARLHPWSASAAKPAHVDRVHPHAAVVVDLDRADPLDEAGQRDAGLEPGQVGAEAEVPAAAEGQDLRQLVLVAMDVVVVGAGEDPLVAVGRAEAEQQLGAPRRDRAVQLDVAQQVARQQLARGVEAQRLLDPRATSSGSARRRPSRAGPGARVRWKSAWPSSLVVVSLPATTIRKRKAMTSSSVSRSPSTSRRLDQRAGQVVARRATPLRRPCPGSSRPARATRPSPAGGTS